MPNHVENKYYYSSCMVTSGVPQGSVLGPILFNIFINDITDSVQDPVTVKLFADDVKLYSEIALPTDIVNFHSCLDKIQTWAVTLANRNIIF